MPLLSSIDTLRYLYSAVLQSAAALTSVFLVVSVFKLQALSSAVDNEINEIKNYLRKTYTAFIDQTWIKAAKQHPATKRREFLEEFKKGLPKQEKDAPEVLSIVLRACEGGINNLDEMDELKSSLPCLAGSFGSLMLLTLIALAFVDEIYKVPSINFSILLLVLAISIITGYKSLRFGIYHLAHRRKSKERSQVQTSPMTG